MICKVCGTEKLRLLLNSRDIHGRHILSEDRFEVLECPDCSCAFTKIEVNLDYYKKYYKDDYFCEKNNSGLAGKLLLILQNFGFRARSSLIKRYAGDNARLLEIGCGRGDFLFYLPGSLKKSCVEINPGAVEFIKSKMKDIDIYSLRLDDKSEDISLLDGRFDIVLAWHSFEHFSDPVILFKNVNKTLDLNGVLIFSVPNKASLGLRLAGERWFHLDTPRHIVHYDRKSIERIAQLSGFDIVEFRSSVVDYFHDLAASFYER
ncbi:MAG TPA: class I SAM-dependent methyltransferase, partial [Candidatus Omnitrophota bacterium]|nr:class I SAM-dependent methyltransferase [Candidatus Omnitrophota bacterium]